MLTTRSDGCAITLDNRIIKTPKGLPLVIPKHKRQLAELIAKEWDAESVIIKPEYIPLVS